MNFANIQLAYFYHDVRRMLGSHKIRIFYIWLSRSFAGVGLYRLERSLYLVFGTYYKYLRIPFLLIINMIQAYSNIEINYQAKIKGGLVILHPSMGIVISGKANIGKNLTLTGGNVIGLKSKHHKGPFDIGSFCYVGANAVIIGPLTLGDGIRIGASSCVTSNCLIEGGVLVGVPAKLKT